MEDTLEFDPSKLVHSTHGQMGLSPASFGVQNTEQEPEVTNDSPPAEPALTGDSKLNSETSDTKQEPAKNVGAAEPAAKSIPELGSSLKTETSTTQSNQAEPTKTEPVASTTPKSWDELLKEQGFDEKFINLAKTYKTKGDLSDYVKAMSTDFGKMSPEQVLRYDLEKQYPKATKDQLDILYQSEIVDKYKLDPEMFDPESREAKAARVKMEMDVAKLADKYGEENAQYTLPVTDPVAETARLKAEQEQQRKQNLDAFKNDPYTKKIFSDKRITLTGLGEGIPDFNIGIQDPEELVKISMDGDTYLKYLVNDRGEVNIQNRLLDAAFTMNRTAYNQHLINYGKQLRNDELEEENINSPKSKGQQASPASETIGEAFKNRGVHK